MPRKRPSPIRRARARKSSVAGLLRDWRAEHAYYRQLLDLLEKQLVVFHAGARPDYALMRDIVHYLRHFPDRFHHAREEVAFRRLVKRDPTLSFPVQQLLQEHRVIAAAGDDLLRRLDEVDDDVMLTHAAVETAAATYLVYYRHHIATEDSKILPCAAQLLTRADWAAAASAASAGPDPLFGEHFEPQYRELRRRIALEAGGPAASAPSRASTPARTRSPANDSHDIHPEQRR